MYFGHVKECRWSTVCCCCMVLNEDQLFSECWSLLLFCVFTFFLLATYVHGRNKRKKYAFSFLYEMILQISVLHEFH